MMWNDCSVSGLGMVIYCNCDDELSLSINAGKVLSGYKKSCPSSSALFHTVII
jgi:hypothetical protein